MALQFVTVVVFLALCLFWPAGTLYWEEAWWFLAIFAVQIQLNMAGLKLFNPELIEERLRPGPGMKDWDQWIMSGFLLSVMATLVVSGLDHRFGWTQPINLFGLGVGLSFLGFLIFGWAMLVNPFFSKVVRIQADRGHRLVEHGPYRFVRHPGYLGWLIQWSSVPLLLNSRWAALPYLVTAVLFLVRTGLEDQTLAEELEGYAAYRDRVRYRIFPGLW